ncbi:MAG: AMP-binding protein, partial [Actinomycetota bacterium]
MGRFSCFLVGDDTLTHRCGEMLVAGGHDVRGVITDAADVRTWADENELPVVGHDEDPLALVTAEPFDYLFSIANLKILSDELVARAQVGTINFHDGPLPAYAGVHSTSWALMNGEPRHGVSWVYVTDVIDGGAIAAARAVEITEDETSFSLNTKCFEAGMETFEQLIGGLADGTNAPQEQDLARRSYFGMWKRPTAAGLIRWDRPASELRSLVRALDLGPTHTNILGVAKVAIGDTAFIVRQAETGPDHASAAPGTVLDITDDAIVVGAVDGSLAITELASLAGEALAVDGVCAATGLEIGQRLPVIGDEDADAIDARLSSVSRHERTWERELAAARLVELPYIDATAEPSDETTDHSVTVAADFAALADERWPDCTLPEATAAAFLLYLVRLGADQTLTVGLHADAGPDGRLFASRVPWNGSIDTAEPAWSQLDAVLTTLATVTAAGTHLRDLAARMPALRGRDIDPDAYPIAVDLGRTAEGAVSTDGAAVTLRVTGADISLVSRNGVVDPDDGARMATQFGTFLAGLANDADRPLHQLPLLTAAEAEEILTEWNRTQGDYPTDETIPSLFAAQVERTPDAVALAYREDEITYRELDRRSSQLANRLVELGVGRDVVVAISVDRSIEMVVSLLAVHKAGGAYLPLDPSYPKERIAFILEDASAAVLISSSDLVHTLPHHNGDVVLVDTDSELIATYADDIDVVVAPDQLAYVIYTSGSTGKPKGVMVEHGNAVSFFWGMDERIPHQEGDVWLAVTSLSFDISVLEIFWTLCRGLKVVIYNNDLAMSQERTNAAVGTPIDFSVFYFSADAGENPDDKYRLLIEGAKFADANGFTAVWTPERHFHEFGGL